MRSGRTSGARKIAQYRFCSISLAKESHPAVNANKLINSGLGTFRTSLDVRVESAMHCKADLDQPF
jgi:hypothetical protein